MAVRVKETYLPNYGIKPIWNDGPLKLKEIQYLKLSMAIKSN